MTRTKRRPAGFSREIHCSVEIAADPIDVFESWMHLEDLPRFADGVRRVKRVTDRCVLWEADVCGRQLVWEARVLAVEPGKRVAWESRAGAPNRGEVRFERTCENRTRVDVWIELQPRGPLERLGTLLGLVRGQVDRDLRLFRNFFEGLPRRCAAA